MIAGGEGQMNRGVCGESRDLRHGVKVGCVLLTVSPRALLKQQSPARNRSEAESALRSGSHLVHRGARTHLALVQDHRVCHAGACRIP